MRLIDAEELYARLMKRYAAHDSDDRLDMAARTVIASCMEAVERSKTVYVPPPPNEPLTLEQLRGMDGEPVWVQYGQYDGEWLIVAWNIYDAISYARKAPFELSVYSYGDTWLAYRRRPEEGTT